MKLVPLADRVLLKPVEAMETTASGIILSTATKEKPSCFLKSWQSAPAAS